MQIVDLIYVVIFSLVMVAIGYIDYKKNIIPNIIVFPAMVGAIIFGFFTSLGWQSCLIGGAVGIGYCLIFWTLSNILHKSILSAGDYKLIFLIGLMTGWPIALLLIGIAFFITGFYIQMKYMYVNLGRKPEKRKAVSVEGGPPFALITIGWLITWLLQFLPATA